MKPPFAIALAAAFVAGVTATTLSGSAAAAGRESARPPAPQAACKTSPPSSSDGSPSSLAVAAGAVWASLGMAGIARIDPATKRIVARIEPGGAVSRARGGLRRPSGRSTPSAAACSGSTPTRTSQTREAASVSCPAGSQSGTARSGSQTRSSGA